MKKTKLKMSFIGLGILVLIAFGFFLAREFEVGLWAFWFAAFDTIIGAYLTANVVQTHVISNNYKPELAEKK